VDRAWHEAGSQRGPALVIVPMDDWQAEAGEPHELVSPRHVLRGTHASAADVEALAELVAGAEAPALVTGALADTPDAWRAVASLAERLQSPVWQESFGARAGFPQDHRLFAGHLPADRSRLRRALAGHDLVLSVGATVGDGSSLYSIQSLWSAQRYRCGVLYVVLNNHGYAVMDRLAETQQTAGRGPWPAIDDVDYTALAHAFGCPAERVGAHEPL